MLCILHAVLIFHDAIAVKVVKPWQSLKHPLKSKTLDTSHADIGVRSDSAVNPLKQFCIRVEFDTSHVDNVVLQTLDQI